MGHFGRFTQVLHQLIAFLLADVALVRLAQLLQVAGGLAEIAIGGKIDEQVRPLAELAALVQRLEGDQIGRAR